MDHVGFKGGTMLRKMVFGPRGRLSTDLDFTCDADITADDLMLMMLDALMTDAPPILSARTRRTREA
jgi:predicted nucleotidyltransferase component of viral defense system